ncbi:hypothetical protein Slin15195_G046910 [Septoria linicola]|uniref:Uncharacterized protein n=1 Tax=Septoria linicola TaxID=215465 RepID=A0A9Q9AST5_9PEZI|nr:hypothetical protein Slin14017_G050440 [Septoria linicola]USW51372.1 hypothetical protein Slin15195_G046910 [Septoria linicola]
MAQTDSMRCMDDFLINPTISSEHEMQQSNVPSTKQHYMNAKGKGKASLYNEMAFDFWPTYTSDEEATSPLDDDSASQYSVSSDFSVPEVLEASSHNVEPQCQRAQTVVIQSAGPARMVSMPKTVVTTRQSLYVVATSEHKRPSITIPQRKSSIAKPRSARTSQDTTNSSSRNNSLSSAAPQSPVSTAPSSVYDDAEEENTTVQDKRVSRHIDLMQAARAISPTSPVSPMLPRASTLSSLPAPSIRRKSKFTYGFTLNRMGKTFVRRESNIEDTESTKEPEPVNVTRNVTQPKRYSSGRPKLVARAANERAPTIVLPPFPDE